MLKEDSINKFIEVAVTSVLRDIQIIIDYYLKEGKDLSKISEDGFLKGAIFSKLSLIYIYGSNDMLEDNESESGVGK